jgi:hypothetical protein
MLSMGEDLENDAVCRRFSSTSTKNTLRRKIGNGNECGKNKGKENLKAAITTTDYYRSVSTAE